MRIDAFPGVLTKQVSLRPCVTKKGREGVKRVYEYVLTDEQEAWLRKWFPEVENSRIKEASGIKDATLHRFARALGLTKSEKGLRGIKKRQAAHVKRLLERNGYYDSLRGRSPSEATRRATAQMWKDVREGRRESPVSIMKREHPRRYRKWMQRKSVERKETIRKEKLRVVYGLERKTNLKCVVMCKYTKSQTAHRYNALRRGYIVMEDCSEQGGERYNIYYDDDTVRSDEFEKNLCGDGFSVIQWQEQ